MGTVANKDDDGTGRGSSESSGLDDILEIAASLGIDDEKGAEARSDDDDEEDDLHNIAAGYGGSAAAALVDDASVEPPPPVKAANAPKSDPKIPVAAKETAKPPPPPPAKASASAAAIPVTAAASSVAPKAATSSPAMRVPPSASTSAARVPVVPVASSAPPKKEERGKGGWMIAVIALLAIGGVGAWLVVEQNQRAQDKVVTAEVRQATPAPEPTPEPPKPEPVAVAPVAPPPVVEEPPPPEPVAEPTPAPAEEVEATVTKRKGKKGSDDGKGSKADAKGPVEEEEEDDGKFSAECLLDPSKPGCEEILRKRRGGKGTNLDATLADKLTQSQIKAGVAKVKGKAKACGAEAGTTVRVKLSISGDGEVLSAEPLSPHDGGDPIGNCVADALKSAQFDRFSSAQQGTTYAIVF